MSKFPAISAVIGLAMLFLSSCNQPFDPRAPLQQQLVVFSVLSTDRNVQFVRVEHDYMPSDFDPLSYSSDNSVTNAVVTIKDGNLTYRLRDTSYARPDTSRYKSPFHAYVLSPFTPQYGRTYQIAASSPDFGTTVASVVIPAKSFPSMALFTSAILDRPGAYTPDNPISFYVVLSTAAKGYYARLFVDYDVLMGSEWVEGRVEVPLSFLAEGIQDLTRAIYPQLTRASSTRLTTVFKNALYRAALNEVANIRYKSHRLIFNRVVLTFLQVDQNLFNYYYIVHAYRDAASMRLDEPMYSNIAGGTGLFGVYTLDSLVHLLPEDFGYNNR